MHYDAKLNVPETRQELLAARLSRGDQLIASRLAQEFDVSLDTIRRDIIALERAGMAQRVRGGAVAAVPAPPIQYRLPQRSAAADAMIQRALQEVAEAKTLLIDGGSTLLGLAERLPPRPGLLVITPSPWIAVACQKQGIAVFMLGGDLSASGGVNVGDTALLAAGDLHAEIALLGVCGIDSTFGLSADDAQEARLKQAMASAADRTLILASRDKIGRRARHRAVPLTQIDTLITDAAAADTSAFAESGPRIVHA
ncbi:DeoR/GlpR family DNA-binding transcription regulator [Salinicola sp. RZ23]|uniref:DeoR/GlpR family DNA-binding transcription regulator n=1 Tax=Salinicola sp. RZ23 TaxID=1949087 RepID=UPI000DA246ED|nr:DeoR/GlpR family DNA-binding transcription regulator [Salinicola sp. RZ23]